MTLGECVRLKRQQLGIDLVQLAVDLGLSVPFLSRFERGRITDVDPALLARIAKALGIDPSDNSYTDQPSGPQTFSRSIYRRMGGDRR